MSEKIWSDDAWADYLYWQTQDKKTLKRIDLFITLKETGYILFPAVATMMTSNLLLPSGSFSFVFSYPASRSLTPARGKA